MRPKKLTPLREYQVHLRLEEEQFNYIDEMADAFGVTLQEYIRLLIDSYRYQMEAFYEDAENNSNDQL